MRRVIRENAPCAALAAAGAATMAWLALYGFAWNDYEVEVKPAIDALLAGNVGAFLRLAPAYGGSVLERAPFALATELWGGGALAIYRMMALPCLLASVVLAVVLVARMRAAGSSRLARGTVLALCVANPLTLIALELGHPEELLGGCLCVLAVLAAAGRRELPAGVLLGLAVANKEWALLAAAPVLLALPPGRRLRCAAVATALAAAVLAPLLLSSGGQFASNVGTLASSPSVIFQPWQAFWFFGSHGALVHGLFGAPKYGYRQAAPWAGRVSHPLILLVGAAIGAALWLRPQPRVPRRLRLLGPRRPLTARTALLALALLLLLRCALDTWDTAYYALPFLLALLAYDALGHAGAPPLLALVATALVWISFEWLPGRVSPDAEAALFLAWTLPLALVLGAALVLAVRPGAEDAAQSTVVSSLGRLVSTSAPFSVTTTRSSIRTPSAPGR